MAILQEAPSGRQHVLMPYHVFGRSAVHADTVLSTTNISLFHASAQWCADRWTLTDQSRNGSFINGRRLTKGQPTPMSVNDEICFGDRHAAPWKLTDASAPADLLIPLRADLQTITLDGYRNFPDDAAPQACIYRSADGQWVMETKDGATLLVNDDLIEIEGNAWRLVCADLQLSTSVPTGLVTCMRFQASLDEEHVKLTLERGGGALDLGERVHHYLLLLLARQRLNDAARGFDVSAQGWLDLDDLVSMLHLEKTHLNIQIFRLRKQFELAVSQGFIEHDFIERRRGSVRLGNVAVEIRRGSQLEGCWQPGAAAGAFSEPRGRHTDESLLAHALASSA